eukprot:gene25418-biopygen13517
MHWSGCSSVVCLLFGGLWRFFCDSSGVIGREKRQRTRTGRGRDAGYIELEEADADWTRAGCGRRCFSHTGSSTADMEHEYGAFCLYSPVSGTTGDIPGHR